MKRDLEWIEIPGEHEARERTWAVVQSAFAERSPVDRRARRLRPALALAVVLAAVAAALSPPGRAVLDEIREVRPVFEARIERLAAEASGRELGLRLLLARSAAAQGATVVNHCAAVGLERANGRVADAVYAASCVVPFVPPLRLDGRLLADGSWTVGLPVLEAVKHQA